MTEASTRAQDDQQTSGHAEDHPRYPLVLKMVLWGESRELIDERMRANGVESCLADQLYQCARAERIRHIRAEYVGKLCVGAILVLGSIATFYIFWLGLGFIPRILLVACIGALVIGAWKLIDGLSGWIMAAHKTGSIADHD